MIGSPISGNLAATVRQTPSAQQSRRSHPDVSKCPEYWPDAGATQRPEQTYANQVVQSAATFGLGASSLGWGTIGVEVQP